MREAEVPMNLICRPRPKCHCSTPIQKDLADLEKESDRWQIFSAFLITSVVDPNTLNLDPDPGFLPNLDPYPGLCYQF